MNAWRAIGASLLVVGCLGVSGCTPDPGPVVTESLTASPSATVSGSATPLPSPSPLTPDEALALLPPEARSADLEGAKATAEFFVTLYAPMFKTGDVRLWRALSTDQCEYCADALDDVAGVWERGWLAEGGDILPVAATTRGGLEDDGSAQVKYKASFDEAFLVKDGAAPELQDPGGEYNVYLELVVVDGHWHVNGITVGE